MRGYGITGLGLTALFVVGFADQGMRAEARVIGQIAQQIPNSSESTQIIVLFVNPQVGDDRLGNGTQKAPFKTITQALRVAAPNTVISLARGTYTATTGEIFPIQLQPGVTLQGEPQNRGQSVVIQGGGYFLSPTFAGQNVTLLGADRAGLTGVTVTNPNERGYGLWIESSSPIVIDNTFAGNTHDGISVAGQGSPVIRSNLFARNGANGISLYGTSRAEVRENTFEQTGFGINVAQEAAPLIIGNRISGNKDGIVIQARSSPVLRNNLIENSFRDGVVTIAQARPDLGTPEQPGGNLFSNNGRLDINAQAAEQMILAFGNQLARDRLQGRINLNPVSSPSTATVAIAPPPVPQRSQPPTVQQLQAIVVRSIGPLKPSSLPTSSAVSAASFPVPSELTPPAATPNVSLPQQSLPAQPIPIPVVAPVTRTNGSRRQSSTQPIPIPVIPPSSTATLPITPIQPIRSGIRASRQRPQQPIASQPIRQPIKLTTGNSTAIPIPVPPPESSLIQRSSPSQPTLQPSQPRSLSTTTAQPIPIAVIPAPAAIPLPPAPSKASRGGQSILTGLLPVPSARIPIGNVGNGNTPPPPSFQLATGLRYRVLIEGNNEAQKAQVRSIVPDAFSTFLRGRQVIQAGAFAERTKADELLQLLLNNGVQARVEEL